MLLVLTALLSAVPVALAATFTLAAALGAKTLALKGVLLTRLSALHEAATIDVLCCDKTGTLTLNELKVGAIRPTKPGYVEADVLGFAALASSADGQDPIDAAIRDRLGKSGDAGRAPRIATHFLPFDPATKTAEATVADGDRVVRIIKGAPAVVSATAPIEPRPQRELDALTRAGYRALAVAAGPGGALELIGFIAFADPPRPDSAGLLNELRSHGVRAVMITGDAAATAAAVAHAIGLEGRCVRRVIFPTASARKISRSMPASCRKRNFGWSRRSRRKVTPSACAATAPTTRRRYGKRKWGSRCRRRRTWPRRQPAWF